MSRILVHQSTFGTQGKVELNKSFILKNAKLELLVAQKNGCTLDIDYPKH